ncbi:MAG: hypothetical protein AAFR71_05335 [Pseudomonadota bacterium]
MKTSIKTNTALLIEAIRRAVVPKVDAVAGAIVNKQDGEAKQHADQ